jgi:hypothetical protein
MRSLPWLLAIFVVSVTLVSANDSVSVQVNPTVSVAPASLAIRVRVAPEANNRVLEIVVDSKDFYRSSRVELDGEHAPSVNTLKLVSVPAGNYEVTAAVVGTDGPPKGLARVRVEVLSNGRIN